MNPIEILHSDDIQQLGLKSRYYLVRPLIGVLNASCVPYAAALIKSTAIETGGIDDKIIKHLNTFENRTPGEGVWGFEPPIDPRVAIAAAMGCRDGVLLAIDPTGEVFANEDLQDLIGSVRSTLQYMSTGRMILPTERIKQVADALNLSQEIVLKAINDQFQRRAQNLASDIPSLLETIHECGSYDPDTSWDVLPLRTQFKVAQSLDKSLGRSVSSALSTILNAENRIGDIPMLQSAQKALKAWTADQARSNPGWAALELTA